MMAEGVCPGSCAKALPADRNSANNLKVNVAKARETFMPAINRLPASLLKTKDRATAEGESSFPYQKRNQAGLVLRHAIVRRNHAGMLPADMNEGRRVCGAHHTLQRISAEQREGIGLSKVVP